MNDPKILALDTRVLQADINSDTAKAAGSPAVSRASPGLSRRRCARGRSTRASTGTSWPIGKSIYHSFQAKIDKRFSKGCCSGFSTLDRNC